MFWDIGGKGDRAVANAANAVSGVVELSAAIDRLVLINRAMWELLAEHHGLTEAELDAKVEEIDLRDGRRDGRLAKGVGACPQCQRCMDRRHGRCLYCGHEGERDPFDSVR